MQPPRIATIVGIVFLILYILLMSNSFNGDGLGYARVVESADSATLYSVSARLLYCPTGKAVLGIAHLLGSGMRSVRALQILNSIFGAIGVAFFFLTAYRTSRKTWLSMVVTVGLGFSFAYWFWCTNATSYPGNICLLIITLYLIVRMNDAQAGGVHAATVVLIGLTHALAGLFWLTAVLLVPAVAFAVFTVGERRRIVTRLKSTVVYGISFGVFLIAPLLIAGFATGRISSLSEFPSWMTAASYGIPPELSLLNLSRGIIGFSSSIIHLTDIGPVIKQIVWNVPFVVESKSQLYLEIVLFALLWITLAIAVIMALSRFKKIFAAKYRLLIILIAWVIVPAVFGLVWLGSDTERWLAVLPILWLGLLLVSASGRKALEIALSVFVGIVIVYNGATAFIPNHNPENNPYMQSARQLAEHMSDKDIVFLWGHDYVFTGDHLAYFFHRQALHIGQVGREQPNEAVRILTEAIEKHLAEGGRVFVSGRIFLDKDVPESHVSEEEANISRLQYKALFSNYSRTEAFVIGKDTYWELFPTD